MSYGSDFVLTLFTNDVELARRADEAGVDRIGLDLERVGRAERQAHPNTWISDQVESDLPALRQRLRRAKLFARTDPVHPGLREEIDRLIEGGVDVLMLPFFRTVREAAHFIRRVAGRCEVSLLVETPAAAVRIREIVRLKGIDEIHIGLNDLYLGLGLESHFELLNLDFIDTPCRVVRGAGLPLGVGGVARVHDERLPIPSDLVYAQCVRLEADRALVSRAFTAPDYTKLDLRREVEAFRTRMDEWRGRSKEDLVPARYTLRELSTQRGRQGIPKSGRVSVEPRMAELTARSG